MIKQLRTLLLLLLLTFVMVACGSDADTTVVEPDVASEDMASDAEMNDSILEIAAGAGTFTTLAAALDAAGLADTFADDSAGPFTVFAPTDDAFAALPDGVLEILLEDPEGALTDILQYHVVTGAVMAADVTQVDSVETLLGEEITVTTSGSSVMLNGSANVTATDLVASNGVVHVIDSVLLPPSMSLDALMPATTIASVAADAGSFDTLLTALDAAGLASLFADPEAGPFTVFAPTDAAFANLPEGTVSALLEDPQGDLTAILQYHVVSGEVTAAQVVELTSADTLLGESIAIDASSGSVVLNDTVNVVTTDIMTDNGIIHVIDAVLMPPSMQSEMQDLPTIAQLASDAGSFGTLLAALDAAGLAATFADADAGPFTVFAPTDDAFAALPAGTVESLLQDPQGQLTSILQYHVAEGVVPASDVVGMDSIDTLLGQSIMVSLSDGMVFLNNDVKITVTDLEASNGIVHVIDAVLLPPSDDAEMMDDMQTIAGVAMADDSFSTLVTALQAAGLAETLADANAGPFTVFAPTNDAFAALPEGALDSLLADPQGALADVLRYHVVEGEVTAEQVVTLNEAMTLLGAPISIAVEDGNVILNGNAMVVTTDIMTANGIVHVIDAVLLPPSDDAAMMDDMQTIADVAMADDNFSTLVTALQAAELAETFADPNAGPFTVFAPTNDAFAALPEGTVESLLQDPQGALTTVLTYHVVEGEVTAEQVVGLSEAMTLQGEPISIAVEDGNVILNGNVMVIATDIMTANGIIHVIDGVLLPPSMTK